MVEDLRTLALADAGRLDLHKTTANLEKLVRRIVSLLEPKAKSKQVVLNFQVEGSCPKVLLDPGRVEQILMNVLTNALRHTPEHGRVTLVMDCRPEGIRLAVRDTGPGIPRDALPFVFDRFYRADGSRARDEGGTGLGLSIARKLAEAHGGSLTADNHPEGGAVITLSLPVGLAV